MRLLFILVAILACLVGCNFPILAANDEPLAAQSPSEESSSKSGEKPDATPDAECFYGVPDAGIDDPDGYVNLGKEKNADSTMIAKVKKDEPVGYRCTLNRTWGNWKVHSDCIG